jgi:putative copper export protein
MRLLTFPDPAVAGFDWGGQPVIPLLGQLAPAVDGVRVTIHVLAAAVWVGGQITVAGLVPTARQLGNDAPRRVARAFSRLSWPAYGVLVATGIWNVAAVHKGQSNAWQVVLGVKIGVVALAGLSAWLHGRSRSKAGLAAWGALTSLSSLAALTLGVFLGG